MICVNRAWSHAMPDAAAPGLPAEILAWYRSVSDSHRMEIARMREDIGREAKEIRVLNELERDVEGVESLRSMADQLEPAKSC
jgi:hypothetical protein